MRGMATLKDPISEAARQTVLRLMGDMEQKDLAARAGQPYRDVHKFVNGQGRPQPSLIDDCLRALGTSLCEQLEGTKPLYPPPSDDERRLLRAYGALQPRWQKWLVESAQILPTRTRLQRGR